MNAPEITPGSVGVVVPVITPLDEREHVDEHAFRAVIRRCLDAGTEGIFAGGSAGLGPLLTDRTWRRVMEIAREEVSDGRILMGGVIATSAARAIEQIRVLEQVGIKSMAITPPFYIPLKEQEEYLAYFGACRQATGMQMVVYNIPSLTKGNIPVEAMHRMAREGWVGLIKESSGSRDYFSALLAICREFGIGVMQGNEPDMAWGLSCGAAGVVPVCANYEPRTYVAAVQAARRRDTILLEKAQQRASWIREQLAVDQPNWIGGIMYGLSTLGIGRGLPTRPLASVTDAQRERIQQLQVLDLVPQSQRIQSVAEPGTHARKEQSAQLRE